MAVECDVLANDIVVNDSAGLRAVSLVNAVCNQSHTLTPEGVTPALVNFPLCVCACAYSTVCVCIMHLNQHCSM